VRDGAHVLGVVDDVVSPYLGTVLATRGDGAGEPGEHGAALQALLAAWVEAEAEVVDPARRAEVVALLQRQPDTGPDVAEQMYRTLLDPVHGLCVGGAVDPRALEAVLRLRAEQGGFEREHDLAALSSPGGALVHAPGS
jgi:ABC-type nitrate/sulfonate/bicarbonate transport system substrate-binding protein